MSQQKALFFLRHYNDIDHITPVIYKWSQLTGIPARVLIRTNPDYLQDYRIQFLQQQPNVSVSWIGEFLNDQELRALNLAPALSEKDRRSPLKLASRAWERFVARPAASVEDTYGADLGERILSKELAGVDQSIVVFDWVSLSETQLKFVQPMIDAAHRRGFVTISLPHGDSPYANRMFKVEDLNYADWEHYGNNPFDHVVVPNPLTATRYLPCRPAERVHTLGSPRYNREWLDILDPLIPDFTTPKGDDKLKVVLFLRNPRFTIYWEELVHAMKLITQFPEVHLLVKHHTRGDAAKTDLVLEGIDFDPAHTPNLEVVYDDIHSASLIRWADVVLDLGTSVVNEAIVRGKPVLALEYLHANISTTAHYLPGTAMYCRDDLYDSIAALIKDRSTRRYSEDDRQYFVREMVEHPDEHVLERFVRFLQSQLSEKVPQDATA